MLNILCEQPRLKILEQTRGIATIYGDQQVEIASPTVSSPVQCANCSKRTFTDQDLGWSHSVGQTQLNLRSVVFNEKRPNNWQMDQTYGYKGPVKNRRVIGT
jgi:hypothetical protein